MDHIIVRIAQRLNIQKEQIEATLKLLDDGNTVPFIARYRKEMTKGLDEEQIRIIQEEFSYQKNLEKRKEDVLRLIEQQGKLDDEIRHNVMACVKLSEVEDIYRPYQQKRKTRATEAIRKGLVPLADVFLLQNDEAVEKFAYTFLNNEVNSIQDALQGAMDIIAERISDDVNIRRKIKKELMIGGKLVTKEKKDHDDQKHVYQMYYDYEEKLTRVASHRWMAVDRAEKEKVINVSFVYDKDHVIDWSFQRYTRFKKQFAKTYIEKAVQDGLKRLAFPSVEKEVRNEFMNRAHEKSIEVFSLNLERLLLQPAMKQKRVLGFDPAFRTGCKLAVLDVSGNMEHISVIYPHPPVGRKQEAENMLLRLIKDYHIDLIAIGNGTASRESESFVAEVIKKHHLNVAYTIVSEAGASVYSASDLARSEFPDLQVEQRSAISIGRRLQDPLSELIKIDPQAIGVGQYQHDLPPAKLKERLDFTVEKAVNLVGVNVNTASVSLLQHVAGLKSTSAKAIVSYREEYGPFTSRKELKKVPKIGAKTYEQAIGFLRVEHGSEMLDRTGIHPESYDLAYKILQHLQLSLDDMGSEHALEILKTVSCEQLCSLLEADVYTVQDILDVIALPLRDYRDRFDAPILRSDILDIKDLHIGDQLEGVVRNVVDFGAFVDIGLHDDGLIHISKMRKHRIHHPSEVVNVGDIVTVWVHHIDLEKEKVQLTLLNPHKS